MSTSTSYPRNDGAAFAFFDLVLALGREYMPHIAAQHDREPDAEASSDPPKRRSRTTRR